MSFAATASATTDFRIVGPDHAPVVLVLGGISADRRVCRADDDPSPGWWDAIAGPGRAIDTGRQRVLGVDWLDGGCREDGRPARVVTTHHQADAIAGVLDALAIDRVQAVVGASYGGMVALALAERHPARAERLVVIGAAHRAHPMASARRLIQRRIIELGLDAGLARDALVIARALAMTTYRSDAEFARRFAPGDLDAVASYLWHQGDRFARRFPPARFLALSLSSDLHAVEPAGLRVPTVLVALENDAIAPRAQLEELARATDAPCRLVHLPTIHGHDAFLIDTDRLGRILRNALDEDLS